MSELKSTGIPYVAHFTMSNPATPSTHPLSPAQCVDAGGHCFESSGWTERTCKHCGRKQAGVAQEAIRWTDAP